MASWRDDDWREIAEGHDRRAELGPILEDDDYQSYLDAEPADVDRPRIPGLEPPPIPREPEDVRRLRATIHDDRNRLKPDGLE